MINGKVSVIMGIYNCASTLVEAIESICSQTYTNWELIMCDDGSSDNTFEVATAWLEKMPDRIKLLRHEANQGLNITLNDCLAAADGEFIARMDGDDLSVPERFAKQVAFLQEHPEISFVSSTMLYFDETGIWGKGKPRKEEPTARDFANGCPFCHAPAMVRAFAYQAVHGYSLDKYTLRLEDYDLWARMYAIGLRGYNFSEPLYMMRDDKNAFKRRKFKYAINGFVTRVHVAKMLKLPFWVCFKAIRPFFVSLCPWPIYRYFHLRKKRMSGR